MSAIANTLRTIRERLADGEDPEDDVLRRNRQFRQNPDRSLCPLPADAQVTPAVTMFVEEHAPSENDGDLYHVLAKLPSADGPRADVLILRGHEYMRCDERSTVRAIQVRDLEELIDQDRLDIPFGLGARDYNFARGWCRGGRTLASLGITSGVGE